MLGVLGAIAVGGKSKSRKKRRARGLKSRRLNNRISNKSYKKGRGITRRYLRKGKTTRKLRKHN